MSGVALLLCTAAFWHVQRSLAQSPAPRASGQQAAAAGAADDLPVIRLARNPDPAPALQIPDLQGRPLALENFRGKVVLITFWATWCGPCREEVPDLIALQQRYNGKLQILGLSVDDGSPEDVQKFVTARKINYPVAIVPESFQDRFGGVNGLPTVFLLDTSGRIVQKHVGLRAPDLYEREIRALLGMPVEGRVETFEDHGQIWLRNASRATEFPELDLSKLTPPQRRAVIRRLNEQPCDCGCRMTLAQCRINDSGCERSLELAQKVIAASAAGQPLPPNPAASTPAKSNASPRR